MSTNQKTGCFNAVLALWMIAIGVMLILASIFNNSAVGNLPLFVGFNSIGIGAVLLSLYRVQNPQTAKSVLRVVATFESSVEANVAAMYLRSHNVVAIITNTDDAAFTGITSPRGIYIKVPIDQEPLAIELLDADSDNTPQ